MIKFTCGFLIGLALGLYLYFGVADQRNEWRDLAVQLKWELQDRPVVDTINLGDGWRDWPGDTLETDTIFLWHNPINFIDSLPPYPLPKWLVDSLKPFPAPARIEFTDGHVAETYLIKVKGK